MINQLMTIDQETQAFELVQRHAKMLSASTLVPKEFQGNMANCAIGLNIAKRLGADPFMVIQNIDIIHGRPSFRATFLIAMVNASGRFTPLQFRMTGDGQTRGCTATSTVKETGESIEGPEITMAMAKAEGWSTKAGSKWLTMPELMLRYRAAAFFARIYAPDITLGMHTSEEIYDIAPQEPRQATGRVVEGNPMAKLANPYDDTTSGDALAKGMAEAAAENPDNPFMQGHAEAMEPAQNSEPPFASPAEVSEESERLEIYADLNETCREVAVSQSTFEGRAKKAGLIGKEESLKDVPITNLREIHANRLAIAKGEYTGGGK